MKKKAVVLLSAGLDSTVNLYLAQKNAQVVLTLTFDYGQKAAQNEMKAAQEISKKLKIKNLVVNLPWLKSLGQSSLTMDSKKVPTGLKVGIENTKKSIQSAKSVWIPNRNGIFLNIAAGFAESIGAQVIVPGFNAEEAVTFSDNSLGFVSAATKSFAFSTANHVAVQCYTIQMSKNEIVKAGKKLKVPFESIWPCYQNLKSWCGQCESCLRAKRAFKANQVDLTESFINEK